MEILYALMDVFFPRLCPGCMRNLSKGERELCLHCLSSLPETGYYLKNDNPISQKFIGRFAFHQAAACYYFQKSSHLQNIIHHFKYKSKRSTALFMGAQMGKLLKESPVFERPDAIVPVPLHPARQRARGYNQSQLLAKGIARELDIPIFPKLLKRTFHTQSQTKLDHIQRWLNVKSAFALNTKKVSLPRHLLLVDDVITSGATLEACAKALSKIEGVKISMVTLATAEYL